MSGEVTEYPRPVNPLPPESVEETRAARRGRKAFAAIFGPFVKAMNEMMAAYHAARADGMERDAGIAGIEETLRQVWPRTKFPPACLRCDDIGYEELTCTAAHRCQRRKCQEKPYTWEHPYVDPCPCDKGDKFRPKYRGPDDAIGAAAKVSKPKRGFTRFGS